MSRQPAARQGESRGLFDAFRERYMLLDRRVLGLFRIAFGLMLFVDCVRRIPVATIFYSNDGILSNHFSLFAPLWRPYVSLFTAFSTPTEVRVALVLTSLVYVLYTVGLYTRFAQVAAIVLYTSLNLRNWFMSNGGCVVMAIVVIWAALLPLSDRFSIDAVRRSLANRDERKVSGLGEREALAPPGSAYFSIVAAALAIEIAAIYFFNGVHKTGDTWKQGESVHWVLWQNRIATAFAAWLRTHEPTWFSPMMTKGTLFIEVSLAAFSLSPVFQRWTRVALLLGAAMLHLGIAATMTLGPFSYVMIVLCFMIFPGWPLDRAAAFLSARAEKRTVVYDGSDAGLHFVARVLARLDAFGKLTFVDARDDHAPEGRPDAPLAVRSESGWTQGPAAWADASRSLPIGQILAPIFASPLGAPLLGWLYGRRAHLAQVRGWTAADAPDTDGPSVREAAPITPFRESLGNTLGSLREAFAGILMLTAVLQISQENWWLPQGLRGKVPDFLRPLVAYAGITRGWSMFAPDAPKQDGKVVVDGVTADGRHLDPLADGAPPDLEAPLHGPWYQSQLECDWHLKISFDGNRGYREDLRKYLLRWHELTGRGAQDRLVSFEVYWVGNDAPPPGSSTPTNITKRVLLSHR